ncbi:hypothetical protein OAB94_01615 [Flavobacteriaceae bacterium]|nr:hypothetical protein [Flavobacteriaceae bacterium]
MSHLKIILVPTFWIYMGICFWSISNNIEPTYSKSFLFLINALTGGFSVYGFVSLMANIMNSNSWIELKSKIKANFKDAFSKEKNGRKMD